MYLNFQCVCVCVRARARVCARAHMRMAICGLEIFAMCAIHLAVINENAIPLTFQPNIS